ncbi:MAG TPA: pilus assembly protein PilM [Candidatus Dormibacteraeota bacterium]
MIGESACICLDVQFGRIAATAVAGRNVRSWLIEPLPDGLLQRFKPSDPAATGRELRAMFDRWGLRAAEVRLALPDGAVVTRVLDLPRMKDSELRTAIRYLAEKEIPMPLAQAAWGWAVAGRSDSAITIIMVAAWSDVVGAWREALAETGLRLTVVEPRAMSLARALQLSRAIVLETVDEATLMTVLDHGGAAYSFETRCTDADDLTSLIQRGRRHLAGATGPGAEADVVFAGGLEEWSTAFQSAVPARDLLNAHAPARPLGMAAAHLLPALGLAMKGEMKRAPESTFPLVNLAAVGSQGRRAGRWSASLRRAALIAVAVPAWAVTGVGIAILAGWHIALPFGP